MSLPTKFKIDIPSDRTEGHYADFASVWHGQETVILDFAAAMKPPQAVYEDGEAVAMEVSAKVVTRVRIPASQCFELMRALEKQLSQWEKERGLGPGPSPSAGG
jgi:hypothetical protein